MTKTKTTVRSVFHDLGFSSDECRILELKARLGAELQSVVKKRGLSQKKLVSLWGVPQPRVSEALSNRVHLVSLDRLVTFLAVLGVETQLQFVGNAAKPRTRRPRIEGSKPKRRAPSVAKASTRGGE